MSQPINNQEIFELLACKDLRSASHNQQLIKLIASQEDFDVLFSCLFHQNRLIVAGAVDAIDKISMLHPSYLFKHKTAILMLCEKKSDKESAWHLAVLAARLPFSHEEAIYAFDLFRSWVVDIHESKIVRVNALQTLYEITRHERRLKHELEHIISKIEKEKIPSLTARIKKLRKLGL